MFSPVANAEGTGSSGLGILKALPGTAGRPTTPAATELAPSAASWSPLAVPETKRHVDQHGASGCGALGTGMARLTTVLSAILYGQRYAKFVLR